MPGADRNLLFGVLALQMDFISRDALVAAMQAWVFNKARPLGEILIEQGVLSGDRRTLLEALVQEHLKQHDNDPEKSLAAVSSVGSARQELGRIADPDMQASLVHVAAQSDEDAWVTHGSSLGAPPDGASRRFRILRPHAKGGLGEVFVAHDEEVHREVALKEIQDRHADNPESRARFLLEAEITGQLEHPGIVPVYGLGQYADGRPFYAMRFIKGDSLQDTIKRFHQAETAVRDPGERVVALRPLLRRFLDVCNAIAYAHNRGVLHRDLKPGNIMLGQYGETLVVDWGLAKILAPPAGEATTADHPPAVSSGSGSSGTQMGTAIGTPAYMSPEQAAGRLDWLGPASDVYSLGATLYCLSTAKPPFAERELGPLLQQVQRGEFPPPRQVNSRVPPTLEAVCLKAMALRPEERYASPRALADDLEHWLADEPVAAHAEPWSARASRWARRHRTAVVGTGALLVTAVVALAVSTLLIGREQQKTASALHEEEQARRDRAQAQVEALLKASPQAVPEIVRNLESYPEDVLPRLRQLWDESDQPDNRAVKRRVGLALLATDAAVKERLADGMLQVDDPQELLLVRDALRPHGPELKERLWQQLDDPRGERDLRFRAACALAAYDPDDPRWAERGRDVAGRLVTENPLVLAWWVEAFRPIHAQLVGPLGDVFRDGKRPEAERRLATALLADYAKDRPEVLAELVKDAADWQFTELFPKLQAHGERATGPLRAELAREAAFDWNDPPLDPAWTTPALALVRQLEDAQGFLAERFALCQALSLQQFPAVAEGLRGAGYRPIRFRPYGAGQAVLGAAVWTRDGRDWRQVQGLTADEVRARDTELRSQGFQPVDVAGYVPGEGAADRYAALWVKGEPGGEQSRLYVGVPSARQKDAGWGPLQAAEYVPRTCQAFLVGEDARYSGVWSKAAANPEFSGKFDTSESEYQAQTRLDRVPVDVAVFPAKRPQEGVRYAGIWHDSGSRVAEECHGLEPAEHLRRCRELAAQATGP